MANRMIRDWTTSEKIDQLSWLAELFFVRLIMKADDHGCFHANPKLLKAALFPLKDYSEKQMSICLDELVQNSVIQVYESENRQYLKIINFGQRMRTMVSKFPQPADNCPPSADKERPELEEKRREVEKEGEYEEKGNFIFIGDKKVFEVLPILEYYEAQLNGTQKENSNIAWRGMVDSWFTQHIGEAFTDNSHVKNSFKKHYLNGKPTQGARKVAFKLSDI